MAIDEAQFFGAGVVALATELADRGLTVLIAGLDVTFDGEPFEPLPALMALAERVDKLTAICTICGEEAVFHARVPRRTLGPTRWWLTTSGGSRATRRAAGGTSRPGADSRPRAPRSRGPRRRAPADPRWDQ